MNPDIARDGVASRAAGGSELCLACGLCCNGALYANVTVRPEHAPFVRTLGLTLEKTGDDTFAFRQPCPLHTSGRCSAYPHHPLSCQEFRCALLRKYEAGEATLEDSLTIVRSAKKLLAGDDEHPAVGAVSGAGFQHELTQIWDRQQGLRGSGELRRANAERVLQAVALDVYLEKHFRQSKKKNDSAPGRP